MIELIYHMILNIGLLLIFTITLCQFKVIQEAFLSHQSTSSSRIVLILLFGLMGILSTYTGIRVNGAIANTRVISVMIAGIIGGPQVGFLVGIAAGVHRFLIDMHGLTGLACCISTILEGILAGWLHQKLKKNDSKLLVFGVTFVAEVLQMAIILAVARPFSEARQLVSIISIPMILFNSLGVCLMLIMIESFFSSFLNNAFQLVQSTLDTLESCFPYLRKGLENRKAMQQVTNKLAELPWVDQTSLRCLQEDWIVISPVQNQAEQTANHQIALEIDPQTTAILTITSNSVKVPDRTMALLIKQIGSVVLSQLQYAHLDFINQQLQKAQWDHMQAQMNPHFFFNTLSTAASLCQFEPQEAYQMIVDLGDYFRKTLKKEEIFVRYEDEIETLHLYLNLVKKRFEEKLEVSLDVVDTLPFPIMSFMIIPMVQSAIFHSALSTGNKGEIAVITRWQDQALTILVTTNGDFAAQSDENEDSLLLLGRRLYRYYRDRAYFEINTETVKVVLSMKEEI